MDDFIYTLQIICVAVIGLYFSIEFKLLLDFEIILPCPFELRV